MEQVLINSFVFLFDRELSKLEAEIRQYPDDNSLWKVEGQITNPAGNLCLHLCGNLQHYIGAVLGGSDYQRNRPLEFSTKDISRASLVEEVQRTRETILETLKKSGDELLHRVYPEEVLGYPMTTVFFLNHLFGHFGYHLGQINYHRRIIAAPDIK